MRRVGFHHTRHANTVARMKLTNRGRAVLWIIAAITAFALGALSTPYCWNPNGIGYIRCDQIGH